MDNGQQQTDSSQAADNTLPAAPLSGEDVAQVAAGIAQDQLGTTGVPASEPVAPESPQADDAPSAWPAPEEPAAPTESAEPVADEAPTPTSEEPAAETPVSPDAQASL